MTNSILNNGSAENKVHISVAIPVYNASAILPELLERLERSLEKITDRYEIVLAEDGSADDSWNKITILSKKYSKVRALKLSRNFGQHYALSAAIDHTVGEWVVIMDCDLQDQPEEIIKLYSKAQEKYDCVFGARKIRKDTFLKRTFSKIFFAALSYLSDFKIDNTVGNFGIYNRRIIDAIKSMTERIKWYPGMIRWAGFNSTTVDIEHAQRFSGKSTYSIRKLFHLAFDIVCMFSDKPLYLSIKSGFAISLAAMAYGFYIFLRSLLGFANPPLGWASLFVSIWFLFGLLTLNLGVIGLYIARILNEVRYRPVYIIADKTDGP